MIVFSTHHFLTWEMFFNGVLLPFFSALFFTAIVHPFVVKIAKERDLVDNPDARKLNDGLGGAIYINSTQATVENNKFY